MKLLGVVIGCIGILSLGATEILFDGSDPQGWESKSRLPSENGITQSVLTYLPLLSKEFIPVEKGKKYTVSGEFRLQGPQTAMVYFGLIPYTADGEAIPFAAIQAVSPRIALLAEPVKPGSKVIRVKNASDWNFVPNCRLAFNAKEDKSDIPNLELSPVIAVSEIVISEDGTAEIAFKTAIKKGFPADTPVRLHQSGNSYIYAGFGQEKGTWMAFSKKYASFYPGCVKFKVALSAAGPRIPVEFRNVKVEVE